MIDQKKETVLGAVQREEGPRAVLKERGSWAVALGTSAEREAT